LLVSRLLAALRSDAQPERSAWRGLSGSRPWPRVPSGKRHFHTEALTDCYARHGCHRWSLPLPSLRGAALLSGTARGATLLLVAWPISLLIAIIALTR